MAANNPPAPEGETAAALPPPSKQPKLPKNIIPLPEDVPQHVWKLWPRLVEAHLFFPQARERQITARIQAGKLSTYYCPDGSCRINREHMVAIWGEPESVGDRVNPLSAAGREARGDDGKRGKALTSADLELDDPVVGMFRECREMLRDSRADNALLFKNAMDPITKGVKFLEDMCGRAFDRVKELEDRWDLSMKQREQDDEYRHLRDLEISRAKAQEERRAEVVALLKAQLPRLVDKWAGGSLRDFVATLDPALVQTIVETGVLPAEHLQKLQKMQIEIAEIAKLKEQREQVKAAAAATKEHTAAGGPAPATNAANGAASAPS